MTKYVTCESVAAITLHIRDVTTVPINYSGFAERPKALCDSVIAWDTKIPVSAARCLPCIAEYKKILNAARDDGSEGIDCKMCADSGLMTTLNAKCEPEVQPCLCERGRAYPWQEKP